MLLSFLLSALRQQPDCLKQCHLEMENLVLLFDILQQETRQKRSVELLKAYKQIACLYSLENHFALFTWDVYPQLPIESQAEAL